MSLYFNIYFFPIWFVTVLLMLDLKYQCLSHIYSFIVVTVLIAVIGIELLRLYIGCMGNLTEMVPELAGFWMMSLLLQFPLQLFLLVHENTKPFQMERAIQGIMLSFLVVQIFSGFFAVRHASRHQANFFHRMQFTSASDLTNQYRPLCKKD
ncbi:Transmembrane protein 17B [Blattella germanica]|nr:Transmembrane protein 17B [Blattella germanica]